ncbi:hypothetical protein [Crocinitomix algicola]|uniref:hypothetical protein n=1 Tax=Crocinitomix algicola TaxID=1740263 RepID=UPI0008727984|nr:hypothetical protein [Crocinitomix algicola]
MFFKKKKKNTPEKVEASEVVKLKPLRYPPKILIGWAEAISGNEKLRDWFLESDQYKELGLTVHALLLKDDARDWLMKNGFAHLMAMVNGAEGNQEAIHWLEKANFQILKNVALAGDRDDDALKWLINNGHQEFAIVAQRIRVLKDQIEERHNDIHSIGRD